MATNSEFEFLLPDVGEGLEDAEIVQWKVSVGQQIAVNQIIVEIESSKSLVELPSPFAGIVLELLASEGQVVRVGVPIIRIQRDEPERVAAVASNTERTEMLVGSGPRNEEARRQRRAPRTYGRDAASPTPTPTPPPTPPTPATPPIVESHSAGLAKPPVRKLARELGVDLTGFIGSGPDGSVTREDVLAAAGEKKDSATPSENSGDNSRETRTPIRGVRRAMAEAMVASAFTAPHVTEFITVDVTASMQLLDKLRTEPEYAGIRLSPLTLLARAMCIAARRTPQINSFWDAPAQEIVTKHYVNLGIATATDRGLLVPNVKDADQLTVKELARAIAVVIEAAREGRTVPSQMAGGTMSITNIGVFGIDAGTPIMPPGESAIVSLGAVVDRPWVIDGEIAVRQVTTLALSFDHRLVDGAQGSKFLADIAGMLQEPSQLLA
ncbi:MAG TPA: dihydrolipoamide acetyltransferase family protein [Candidatus Paceibacterota bacterium]|nr:dihydrolipoamide acetyltransferase family protein [Candidatus Paceibacterota bacterium]